MFRIFTIRIQSSFSIVYLFSPKFMQSTLEILSNQTRVKVDFHLHQYVKLMN